LIAATCAPATLLSVAADLTSPAETIRTRTIAAWRREPGPIGKRPAVFLLQA
jgi:16S rRNA (cytidine1402-2'-O)-methyltransferase